MDKVLSKRRAGDISAVQAMKELKVSKTTFYRLVKKHIGNALEEN